MFLKNTSITHVILHAEPVLSICMEQLTQWKLALLLEQ
ncbi:hypothetical protein HMPREF9412_1316 [Paenibacillus sp. HGF5]|nr:hypothetical protein HMPREF9412_1316 [Paenibacillus sp. HGF5]